MDIPSEINALEKIDSNKLVRVNKECFKCEIEFKDVWFRYPSRRNEWVLKNLSLKILPKETVALVGESGCGKSTVVALLLRFYDVNHGEILIDGVNIKNYHLGDLR